MTSDDCGSASEQVRDPTEVRLQKLEERMVDMVHVAKLRELVEKWREHGGPADKACADELEEIIE